MRNIRKIITLLKYKLDNARYRNIYIFFNSLPQVIYQNRIHLQVAMDWLARAQDATPDDGVAALYLVHKKKWHESYPETTGYIIPTFLTYSNYSHNITYADRAIRMGNWEKTIQLQNGACRGGSVKCTAPRVFNTGQIILGWCALYRYTKEKKFRDAAVRAAQWLINVQDNDGKWSQYTYQGPKTYHARVALALLELYTVTSDHKYKNAAEANLAWVLTKQNNIGWFSDTSLSLANQPWTHLIAYTMSGLIESYHILKKEELLKSVLMTSYPIIEFLNKKIHKPHPILKTLLPGTFDQNWQSNDSYSCLTGNAQLAIVWLMLYKITKEEIFYDAAIIMIEDLKKIQLIDNRYLSICGGIAGSYPINGGYAPYCILNWATKFFVDALLLEEKVRMEMKVL